MGANPSVAGRIPRDYSHVHGHGPFVPGQVEHGHMDSAVSPRYLFWMLFCTKLQPGLETGNKVSLPWAGTANPCLCYAAVRMLGFPGEGWCCWGWAQPMSPVPVQGGSGD